jgi:hypothetical protein
MSENEKVISEILAAWELREKERRSQQVDTRNYIKEFIATKKYFKRKRLKEHAGA